MSYWNLQFSFHRIFYVPSRNHVIAIIKKYRTTSNLEVKTSSSGKIFKIKKTRMRFLS